MTDEKKAEEYANACRGKIKDIHWQDVRYAVLYGLAEGKPKWHDLRKDPNDLPKLESEGFSWSITVANQFGEACHYNYRKSCWETSFVTEIEGVIAWCELPKFEEN